MLYLSIGVVTLFMASQQKDCPQDTVPGNVGELNDGSTHSFYPSVSFPGCRVLSQNILRSINCAAAVL